MHDRESRLGWPTSNLDNKELAMGKKGNWLPTFLLAATGYTRQLFTKLIKQSK
jgi:hypothetical protein